MTRMQSTSDVVVVGAGPTGLLLAADLARAGVTCTVLERRVQESNLSRAFVIHARTLEMLDARGLADEVIEAGDRLSALRAFGRLDIDMSRLPSRFPFVVVLPQYRLERILEARVRALGAEIVHGAEVTGLRQDADGVSLSVRVTDGSVQTWRARYCAGTDGVRSTVRSAIGVAFPGRSAIRSVMMADVRLADPPAHLLTVNSARDCFAIIAPLGDGWYRAIAWDRRRDLPDEAPVELDEVRDVTRRVFGTDYGMHGPRWMSRFHSDERLAPRYRVGRVFLAGDAAHVDSPAAAQGMNTGLQDAANLSWKLAAAVDGRAADCVLDSYHAERWPVGVAARRVSSLLLRLTLGRSGAGRAARRAVALVVGRSRLRHRLSRTVSGIAISYPRPHGGHRLAGRRAPDVALARGDGAPARLYEALRGGRFVLVARPGGPAPAAGQWADRVDVVQAAGSAGCPLMLVRPDGYVAWATGEVEAGRRDGLMCAALQRWCGAPAPAHAGQRQGRGVPAAARMTRDG